MSLLFYKVNIIPLMYNIRYLLVSFAQPERFDVRASTINGTHYRCHSLSRTISTFRSNGK